MLDRVATVSIIKRSIPARFHQYQLPIMRGSHPDRV